MICVHLIAWRVHNASCQPHSISRIGETLNIRKAFSYGRLLGLTALRGCVKLNENEKKEKAKSGLYHKFGDIQRTAVLPNDQKFHSDMLLLSPA